MTALGVAAFAGAFGVLVGEAMRALFAAGFGAGVAAPRLRFRAAFLGDFLAGDAGLGVAFGVTNRSGTPSKSSYGSIAFGVFIRFLMPANLGDLAVFGVFISLDTPARPIDFLAGVLEVTTLPPFLYGVLSLAESGDTIWSCGERLNGEVLFLGLGTLGVRGETAITPGPTGVFRSGVIGVFGLFAGVLALAGVFAFGVLVLAGVLALGVLAFGVLALAGVFAFGVLALAGVLGFLSVGVFIISANPVKLTSAASISFLGGAFLYGVLRPFLVAAGVLGRCLRPMRMVAGESACPVLLTPRRAPCIKRGKQNKNLL